MPAIVLYPLLAGGAGYLLGLFSSDSIFKWLLMAVAAFFVAKKAGVI